jgi:hypothetical protein
MKAVTTTKLQKVYHQDEELTAMGIEAFQLVKFEYSFYGKQMVDILDTKIMTDGRQIVIDGNGFINGGYEI